MQVLESMGTKLRIIISTDSKFHNLDHKEMFVIKTILLCYTFSCCVCDTS